MPSHHDSIWVILAGGRATRMGGHDKGLVKLNGQPLIDYVYDNLNNQNASIAVNANRNKDFYATYGTVFSDVIEGFPGPLGGIHAAMKNLPNDWLGFVPCDCPNLPIDLVEKMEAAITPETEILVAHDGDHVQPVVTMMHRGIFDRLDAFLNAGERKIVLLYDRCNTQYVHFDGQESAFVNLNSPEELEKFGQLS